MRRLFVILLGFGLVSCTATINQGAETSQGTVTAGSAVSESTSTVTPQPTPTIQPTEASLPPTPTDAPLTVCSLFSDQSLVDLQSMITNPFYRPAPGSDNPHQGLDFSDLDPVNGYALSGKTVRALISGTVVMVTEGQFPYGNAIMVESKLSALPDGWQTVLGDIPGIEREIFHTNLTCPDGWEDPGGLPEDASLYILYAHFEQPPLLSLGETVTCGTEIGKIGMTGNALAPHVHVEFRIGPGDAVFDGMSHYDAGASQTEMLNYCRWRVSGWYQLLDPGDFLFPVEEG